MFQIPVSTLRYYDKEGLFPGLERSGGIRKFTEKEMEALRVIECLKRSGLEIREIKTFMEWCSEGSSTYPKRKELFIRQEEAVKAVSYTHLDVYKRQKIHRISYSSQ